jgi:hypothetical protein
MVAFIKVRKSIDRILVARNEIYSVLFKLRPDIYRRPV